MGSRRNFVKNTLLWGAGSSLFLQRCQWFQSQGIKGRNPEVFNELEWNTLIAVQDLLLPSEKNAPGAREINAAAFFQWVVSDPQLDPDENEFKKKGLTRVEETAQKNWQMSFIDLHAEGQEKVLRYIETFSWGESWISAVLLHLFEALLSDPIYGSNPEEIGWKWLAYQPGMPRPYPNKIYGDFDLTPTINPDKYE